ncbi:MAG: hypothetical protein MUE74_12330 [Bacteroidales bacterium]|jgi:hypothetical protein|nr:hypothetical protein [Bacteroidales bacterium]
MTREKLLSCVFYSVAMAMDLDKAGYNEISIVADSMSPEPIPRKDIKDSVEWLLKNGLAEGRKDYRLTETGKAIYSVASRETKLIPEVWNNIEKYIVDKLNNEMMKDYQLPEQGGKW